MHVFLSCGALQNANRSMLQPTCFKHFQGTNYESCRFALAGRQQQGGDSFLLVEALSDVSCQQKEPSRLSSAQAFVHDEACSLNNATLEKKCKRLHRQAARFKPGRLLKQLASSALLFLQDKLSQVALPPGFLVGKLRFQSRLSGPGGLALGGSFWLQNGFCAGLCLLWRAGHGQHLMLPDNLWIAQALDFQSAMLLLLPDQVGLLSTNSAHCCHC